MSQLKFLGWHGDFMKKSLKFGVLFNNPLISNHVAASPPSQYYLFPSAPPLSRSLSLCLSGCLSLYRCLSLCVSCFFACFSIRNRAQIYIHGNELLMYNERDKSHWYRLFVYSGYSIDNYMHRKSYTTG